MKKVLIIEDDQIVAHIYRNKFIVEGFQVEVAYTGEAGLELINSYRPDAVLLDLVLPKISGVELLNAVRAESQFKTLPLIVFSNTYLTNLVQEAWKAGATKCLSKSNCTPRHMLDAVRAALGLATDASAPSTAANTKADSAPPVTVGSDQADRESQSRLYQDFVAGLPAHLATLRSGLKALVKADNDTARLQQMQVLYHRIHPLTGSAAVAGLVHIAQMCDALEFLLKELIEKPKNLNVSTLRSVANAVDFLGFLFDHGIGPEKQELTPPKILVVDDEAISRRAVTYALEKAKLKSESSDDPKAALSLLTENRFDLVFLDVDMPGMSGFELCTKLRALPLHKKTPIVFVTGLNDFENRANSTMSGGNDFIGKPFLFIELAVKALIHVQRGRLTPAK